MYYLCEIGTNGSRSLMSTASTLVFKTISTSASFQVLHSFTSKWDSNGVEIKKVNIDLLSV